MPKKYLRNLKTGVVLAYSERMAKLPYMQPTNKGPKPRQDIRGMREATFPLPKKQQAELAEKQAEEAPPEPEPIESQGQQMNEDQRREYLLTVKERVSKERSKAGVISIALEELGMNIDDHDSDGHEKKLHRLKNEALKRIYDELGIESTPPHEEDDE